MELIILYSFVSSRLHGDGDGHLGHGGFVFYVLFFFLLILRQAFSAFKNFFLLTAYDYA